MKRISALMGHWYVRIKGWLALYGFVNSSSPMRFEFRLETVAARMGATVLSMGWEPGECN